MFLNGFPRIMSLKDFYVNNVVVGREWVYDKIPFLILINFQYNQAIFHSVRKQAISRMDDLSRTGFASFSVNATRLNNRK